MVNHPGTLKFKGGDLTQLRKTAQALASHGITCSETFDPRPDGKGFDLAHVFNLRTAAATRLQVQALRAAGLPVVMSPIYLDPSVALWANRVVGNIFRQSMTPEVQRVQLEQLARRTTQVQLPGGGTWSARGMNRSDPNFDRTQREILREVAHLIPNSYLEMDSLQKTLGPYDRPFTVAPYACDPTTFLDPDPEPFARKHGLRDFVLQVGRIEASKNQLLLCYALRDLDLPLVLIGGALQSEYLAWCRQFGPRRLLIIPHLPPEELRSAYAAARVHVLPSWIETCGLVTMEAALADCNVVVSTAGYEVEYYRNLAYYCDPADALSISSAVVKAYDNFPRDAERRQRLRELILREYTWDRAALACLAAYHQALAA